MRAAYYLGTNAAIIIYDIIPPETFHYVPGWIEEVITHSDTDTLLPLALVANKSDLKDNPTYEIVTPNRGVEYAKELTAWSKMDIPYIQTSAKLGFNVDVDKMFEILLNNIERIHILDSLSENTKRREILR